MSGEMVRARVRVRGRVQMVGFRAYIVDEAARLNISGTVRNCGNDELECVCEGTRENADGLIDIIKRGPIGARIDAVNVEYEAPIGEHGFMRVTA